MKMNKITPVIKAYLLKMFTQYEEGKLTVNELIQMFQDLLDSGLAYQMGPKVLNMCQTMAKYIQYQEGKIKDLKEQVQVFQDLWDSGLASKMGPEVLNICQRLIRVDLISTETKSGSEHVN